MTALGAECAGRPGFRKVEHVDVRLRCAWPAAVPARVLRGAVVARIEEAGGASVAWHNHDDNGALAQRPPEVLYRTKGGPSLWMVGPRAEVHALAIGAAVKALRLPLGDVVQIDGAEMVRGLTVVGVGSSKRWRRYELVTPLFPPKVAWARRPRASGPERWAWAGHLLAESITGWLQAAGCVGGRPVHVHLHDLSEQPTLWSRPGRGAEERAVGFTARFVTNAVLPDGVGLGQHRSEGFGEVRVCGC